MTERIHVTCVTWLIYMCDMIHFTAACNACVRLEQNDATDMYDATHSHVWLECDLSPSCVWRDSFICVTWLIHMCDLTHCTGGWSRIMQRLRETWLIHMCDVTHSYVWRDSFICVTWLIHMCDVTHCTGGWSRMMQRLRETWLIHKCDVTHSYVWRDSFICVTWLIQMCDVTHSHVWRDSFICVTWLIAQVAGAEWCNGQSRVSVLQFVVQWWQTSILLSGVFNQT